MNKDLLKRNRFLRKLYYRYLNFLEQRGYTRGRNNKLNNNGILIHSQIQIRGNENRILIDSDVLMTKIRIYIQGNNNSIYIHKNARLSGTELWIENDGCRLEIGERTFVGPSHLALSEDSSKLIIGADCMVSSNVQIRTGDSHSILSLEDPENPQRINPAQSVCIGNHVWICEGVKIMKGVTLDQNIIVSSGAIVTSSFEKNLLIGGIPARILKEKVTWDKDRL